MTLEALVQEARRFRQQAQDLQDTRPRVPQGEPSQASTQEWLEEVEAWEAANRWRLTELWERADALEAIVGSSV